MLPALVVAAVAALLWLILPSISQMRAQAPQTASAQAPQAAGAQAAQTAAAPPSFEVASIKPNHSGEMRFFMSWQPGRFTANGMTVRFLITAAYDVHDFQVSGGPGWINSDRYDIDAKELDSVAEQMQKLPREEQRKLGQSMLQSLLADRFKLKLTRGSKEMPAYALVVAKNGPKLQQAKPLDTPADAPNPPAGRPRGPGMRMRPGEITGQGVAPSFLATVLSQFLGRTVLDQTGLKGNYDFTLKWTPEPGEGMMLGGPGGGGTPPEGAPPPDTSGPSIFTAVQEQLGLKLEPTKAPAEVLVVDHVERPSEN
jgi:uncharacterized protein (TIGR03435 family)